MFNLRSLDLNLLTVFEAIYELGTVSGAAMGMRGRCGERDGRSSG
jgi:hypothetical protein